MRRVQRLAAIRGHAHRNNNLDTFMNGVVDAALAMQSFITAAEAVGLGCCPISAIRNRMVGVCALLELRPAAYPIPGLCVAQLENRRLWQDGAGPLSIGWSRVL